MMQLSEIAGRVQRALRPMAQDMVYRATTTFSPKAAALTAVGATTITLNTLPADFDRVKVGDYFTNGTKNCVFTAETIASGGTIAAAPFAPALTAQIASGAAVTITRTTDTPCRGFVEWLDTSTEIAPGIATKDARITVLADSLSMVPKVGMTIIAEGVPRNVKNVGRDSAGAAWVLLASG